MYAGKYTISMDHGQWYMGEHLERSQFVSKPCEGELMDLSFFGFLTALFEEWWSACFKPDTPPKTNGWNMNMMLFQKEYPLLGVHFHWKNPPSLSTSFVMLAEILQHMRCIKPCDKLPINCCKFFSISSIDKFQGTIRCEHRMVQWSRRAQGRFFQGGSKTQALLIFQQGNPNYIQTITSLNRSCLSRGTTLIDLFPCILLNSWIIRWPPQIPWEINRPSLYRRGPSCYRRKELWISRAVRNCAGFLLKQKFIGALGAIEVLGAISSAFGVNSSAAEMVRNFMEIKKNTATFLWVSVGIWCPPPPQTKIDVTIFSREERRTRVRASSWRSFDGSKTAPFWDLRRMMGLSHRKGGWENEFSFSIGDMGVSKK